MRLAVLLPLATLATVEGAQALRSSASALSVDKEPSFTTCNRKSRSGCVCLDECAKARWGGFVCSITAGASCPKAAFPHYDWCCPDKKQSCCVDSVGKPKNYFAHGRKISGHLTVHQQVHELAAKKKGLYMSTVDQYDTAISAAEDWALQAARQAATVEVLKADGDYKHAISAQAEEVAAMAAYDKAVRKAARDEVAWLRSEVAHGRTTNSTVRHKIFGARAAIEETVMNRVAKKLQKHADKAKVAAASMMKHDNAATGSESTKTIDMSKRASALAMLVKMEKENALEAAGLKKAAYKALTVIDSWDWPHQQAAYATVDLAIEAEKRTRKAAHESHELLQQLMAQHQKEKLRAAKTGLWSTTQFREQERQSARAAADGNELEERAASDVERFENVVLAHNKKVALAYEIVAEAAAPAEAAKAAQRAAIALKAQRASAKMSKQVESARIAYLIRAIHDKQVENAVTSEMDHYAGEAAKIEAAAAAAKAMRQRGAILVCAMIVMPGLACLVLRYMARLGLSAPSVEMGDVTYKQVGAQAEEAPAPALDSEEAALKRHGGYQDVDEADLPSV